MLQPGSNLPYICDTRPPPLTRTRMSTPANLSLPSNSSGSWICYRQAAILSAHVRSSIITITDLSQKKSSNVHLSLLLMPCSRPPLPTCHTWFMWNVQKDKVSTLHGHTKTVLYWVPFKKSTTQSEQYGNVNDVMKLHNLKYKLQL